jgi:hypothetical protein
VSQARAILFPLDRERARAGDRRLGVERVHEERAALLGVAVACGLRVGVTRAPHDDLGAVRTNRGHLHGGRNLRNEDPRLVPEPLGCERDRDAVVSPRGGRDPGGRNGAREQVVERAARLERAGVLEQLELERDLGVGEGPAVGFEQRRVAYVRGDARVGRADGVGGDGHGFSRYSGRAGERE